MLKRDAIYALIIKHRGSPCYPCWLVVECDEYCSRCSPNAGGGRVRCCCQPSPSLSYALARGEVAVARAGMCIMRPISAAVQQRFWELSHIQLGTEPQPRIASAPYIQHIHTAFIPAHSNNNQGFLVFCPTKRPRMAPCKERYEVQSSSSARMGPAGHEHDCMTA